MGQNNKQIKGFGQITRKYLAQPFDECNCLKLLHDIYTDLSISVPNEYKGYNLNTYMAYWERMPEQAIEDMMELFRTIGDKADTRFLKRGDAVIVEYKDLKFPSIYIGDNNVMAVTREKGVMVMSLGSRIKPVLARRFV